MLCGSQPHPDLEVSPEHLLLLQLVLLIFPRLDAQFLLSKEAGKVLVQGHHGLIPQLLIVVLAIHSTLKNRRPVSSLAFCGQMQANTDRSGSPSLAPTAHQRLPCLQHRHQLLPEALVHVSIPIDQRPGDPAPSCLQRDREPECKLPAAPERQDAPRE